MHCLLSFIAILAILAQGAKPKVTVAVVCSSQYYSVNTYKAQKAVTITCLESNSSCEVYYSPPGNGCNSGSPTFIGTVPENGTKKYAYNFALGGGFCSESQFSVRSYDAVTNNVLAEMPRATEAGTKFYLPLFAQTVTTVYQCVVSALEKSADFTFDDDDVAKTMTLKPYAFHTTSFTIAPNSGRMIKVTSNTPVIFSCFEQTSKKLANVGDRLVTLQPISSQPLLAFSNYGESLVSVVITDCSTNKLITDFSKVDVSIGYTNGRDCSNYEFLKSDEVQKILFRTNCAILVEPVDENVCASVVVQSQQNEYLASVGIPESKFSTRFPSIANDRNTYVYSFSLTTCNTFIDETDQDNLELTWTGGNLTDKVAEVDLPSYSRFAWVECGNSSLMEVYDYPYLTPFLGAYQEMEVWQPFLDSQCSGALSSYSLCRVTFMAWLAFFGFKTLTFYSS